MSLKIQLVAHRSGISSAWSKAPLDASIIASHLGFEEYDIDSYRIMRSSIMGRILNKLSWQEMYDSLVYSKLFSSLEKKFKRNGGGTLFVQFPGGTREYHGIERIQRIANLKSLNVSVVMLVHDIGSLRGNSKAVGGKTDASWELAVFHSADKLIVHNSQMKKWFEKQGFSSSCLLELGAFDYLCSFEPPKQYDFTISQSPVVAIAGGLGRGKASYVEKLKTIKDVSWRLYGNGFDENRMSGSNVMYCGCYDQNVIPSKLEANFGLVWDGESVDSCSGDTGRYLMFNNPHKFSLYLASGLPVIVWDKSAVSDIVKKYGVGLVVSSLHEIGEKVRKLSTEDCEKMRANVSKISADIRSGNFLGRILSAL